jgi:hypothetical protein
MPSFLVALTAAILLISAPALAQQPSGGSKRAEASGKAFTEKEKEIIKGYFDKENAKKPDGDETTAKGKDKGKDKSKGKDEDTVLTDKGKNKGKGGKGKKGDDETIIAEIVDDDDSGGGKSKKKGKGKVKTASGGGGKGKSGEMPQGLAKRDELPPGLAMQLERNGKLPPGLAKRDLPSDLDDLLPRRRGGLERLIVEEDVVLIDRETGTIMDILDGAARGRRN